MPIRYEPPTPANLRDLKARLEYSGQKMADLFGLAAKDQWRKYSGDNAPRPMSLPMLFLTGATYLGPHATVEQVFDWCRAVGAKIEVEYPQETAGDLQP